jgi:hypothetical protein
MAFIFSKNKSENVLEEGEPWESLKVSRSMLFERMLYIFSSWKVAVKKREGRREE